MFRTMLRAATLGLLATCAQAQERVIPTDADPALFRIADEDTTIYLFGTVHVLDEGRSWFDEGVSAAFEASDELIIETVAPDAATVRTIVLAKGMDATGTPLRSELSAEAAAALEAELVSAGLPKEAFDRMDPWFAALNLAGLMFQKIGMNPESGVEARLQAEAATSGKPVSGLEAFEWQIDLFDTMPADAQVEFLESGIEELQRGDAFLGGLVEAWSDGDMDALADLMNEGIDEDDALRARLLTDRNSNWAAWIDDRLDRPGTVFMAVGAGHLGGKGSVQDALAERGIETHRVAY